MKQSLKKMVFGFLLLSLVLTALPVLAETLPVWMGLSVQQNGQFVASGTCGADLTWTLDENGTLTISGTGDMDDYNSWGNPAPWNDWKQQINAVVIEEGVTSIGDYTFSDHKKLTNVTLPESLTSIGDSAFWCCDGLWMVTNHSALSLTPGDYQYGYIMYYAYVAVDQAGNRTYRDDTWMLTEDGFLYTCINDVYTLRAYLGDAQTVTLPADINGSTYDILQFRGAEHVTVPGSMTSISNQAFRYCSSLVSVTISEGVEYIGDSAFGSCGRLEKVTIPDSVTLIGSWTFDGCNALREIVLSENSAYRFTDGMLYDHSRGIMEWVSQNVPSDLVIPDGVTSIPNGAFSGFAHLTSVRIPDSVTYIGDSAFYQCTALVSIVIPDSVTQIDSYAFRGCSSLTDVAIGNGVTFIGDNAFYECANLQNVALGSNVQTLGWGVFYDCTSLTEVRIPDSVTSMGSQVFRGCTSLETVVLPSGLTEIPAAMFRDCISLKTIEIPQSVTQIGHEAFMGCSSLMSITIPDGVTGIEASTFEGCSSLTGIVLPASVTSIGDNAFADCQDLTVVVTLGEITGLGKGAFRNCSSLREFDIPDGITTLEQSVFAGCSSLTNIVIPDGVTSIGNSAFEGCTVMNNVVIPDSVTEVGIQAFAGCAAMTQITIPETVLSVGHAMFEGCSKLTSVVLPSSMTTLGDRFFNGCSSLSAVTIPTGVTTLGNSAFAGCSSLTSLVIPDSVTKVGQLVFKDCTSLASLKLSENLTSIPFEALANCKSLTNLVIPDSVTDMRASAFSGCTSLQSITLPIAPYATDDFLPNLFAPYGVNRKSDYVPASLKTVIFSDACQSIGAGALRGCNNITTIYIGKNVSSIGDSAFAGCDSLTDIHVGDLTSWLAVSCDAYNGNPMVCNSLGKRLYENETLITELVIPEGVTNIRACAFWNCASIASVVIPDSVTQIGEYAFYQCPNLKTVTIGNGVTAIGNSAFEACGALQNVTFGNQLQNIGKRAFYECGKLSSAILPDSLTTIGESAFYDCFKMTELDLGKGVSEIGAYAFEGCNSLTSVTIPGSVSSLGSSVFAYCSDLAEVVLEEGLTAISGHMFDRCYSLKNVTIPDSVTTIGSCAFLYCDGLETVTIGSGVTQMAPDAFASCQGLWKVVNRSEVALVFEGYGSATVPNIYVVYDKEGNKSYPDDTWQETEDGFLYTVVDSVYTLKAYVGTEDTVTLPADIQGNSYKVVRFRGAKHVIIPEGVTEIDYEAFTYGGGLTTVTIPDSVITISQRAFLGCFALEEIILSDQANFCYIDGILYDRPITQILWVSDFVPNDLEIADGVVHLFVPNKGNIYDTPYYSWYRDLTSIVLPDSVETIQPDAFYGATKLTTVVMPESMTSIGYRAFMWCTNLTEIVIPQGVTSIEEATFMWCLKLSSVTIADSVTTIGMNAFNGCRSLTEITLPSGLTNIGSDAFSECVSLKQIIIPDSVTEIGSRAFADCIGLTNVVLPSGLTAIYNHVFENCTSLPHITIPDSVTDICDYAFSGCANLSSVVLPQSLISIGTEAFEGCSSLVNITIPDGVTSIGISAFYGCSSLTGISLPDSVTSLGASAFGGCTSLTGAKLSAGLTEIVTALFYNCSSLTDVTIPDGVTSIGSDAFYGCSSLVNITIPDGVTSIGASAFNGCSSLVSIVIPDGVTSIGANTFCGCNSLTVIVIPDSVTELNYYAFQNCPNVWHVFYGGTQAQWDSMAGSIYELQYATIHCDYQGDAVVDPVKKQCSICAASCEHTWNEPMAQEPTCTEDGLVCKTCSVCNYEHTEVLKATGHLWREATCVSPKTCRWCRQTEGECGDHIVVTIPAVAPTCTETGFTEGKRCSICGEVLVAQTEVVATGHDYDDVVTEPTCTEGGYTTHTCAACGDSYVDAHTNSLGHDLGQWTVEREAGCEYTGTERGECSRCDHYEYREVPAIGHSYYERVIEPTCTSGGYTMHICEHCNQTSIDTETEALGHDMGQWTMIYDAGCETTGWEQSKCTRCDYTEYRDIPVKGHSYRETVIEASCDAGGYTEHTCENCYTSYRDNETEALGHDMGSWFVEREASCENQGLERIDCSRCDYYESRALPATGHSCSESVTEPTCTDGGYTWYLCQTCGYAYYDNYTEALGHDMGSWYVDYEATCEHQGVERRDCSRCDHYETQDIPMKEHSYVSEVTEPTCTAEGYTTYVCSGCGRSYTSDYTSATGHIHLETRDGVEATCGSDGYTGDTYCTDCGTLVSGGSVVPATGQHSMGEWSVLEQPTESAEGLQIRYCERCDYSETEAIPKLDHTHDYSHSVSRQEPTCTADGSITYTCQCGDSYTEVLGALGHQEQIRSGYPATCTADGLTDAIYCSVCNETLSDHVVIPATGHDEVIDAAVAPTCTETGLTEGKHCSVCGEILVAQEEIAAKGHNYEDDVIAPTCTEDGYTVHSCSDCGASYTDAHVKATGHSWNDGEVTREPTEETEGEKTYTCTACGETRSESIAKKEPVIYDTPEDDSVEIPENDCFEGGTIVTVEVVEEGEIYEQVTEVMENRAATYTVFEFTATKDDEQVQPDGNLTVTFDIPAGYSTNVAVYYMDKNGKLEKLEAVVDEENRTITVQLSHFSTYILTDEETAPSVLLGDVNGDGRINARDARALLRYLAGMEELSETGLAAADFNGDGRVNARDARAILRDIAGLD